MHPAEVRERIRRFPSWHYQFDLLGERTPIYDPAMINRHEQRRRYLLPPLLRLCGGTLRGKRVLDLGCNAGFWSLAAAQHGCDYVLGIDGRQMHVEQARLVFEAHGIDPGRYDFRHADLFDVDAGEVGRFDIVLCLGVFYHVSKHVNLLEWVARVNTDLLLIDTNLARGSGSALELRRDDLSVPGNACDRELVMFPTRAAVLDLVREFGYRAAVLEPRFSSYEGAEDFATGERRAFLCSRGTDLAPVADLTEPDVLPDRTLLDVPASALARALLTKVLRRLRLG